MQHHLDIRVLRDAEMPGHELLSHLFGRVHHRLARGQFTNVAVSFPEYRLKPATLGQTLRLLAPPAALSTFMAVDWLAALRDHVHVGPATPVPNTAPAYCLRRVQAKSNPDRLRRRQMRRHGLSEAQARLAIPDHGGERLALPYLTLTSTSTRQTFRLFLQLTPSPTGHQTGEFNTYGLSSTATTPWF